MILKPLIDLHGEPRNWRTAAPLYVQALSDIPEHLLDKAVKHCIGANAWFPKPAELRAAVADELADYRRRRDVAAMAALPKPPEPKPPTPEDIAAVSAMLAPVKAMLGARAAVMRGVVTKEPAPIPPGEVEHLSAELARRRQRETV